MSPDIIGACRAALFGVVFQVLRNLLRTVLREALLDQRGESCDMGGYLACAEEVAVGVTRGSIYYGLSGIRANEIGLDPVVERRALAAEWLDFGGVEGIVVATGIPPGRAHSE